MKLRFSCQPPRANRRGFALMLVLVFTGISLLLLASAMDWTSQTARMTDRTLEYYDCQLAAEAATEKVLSRLIRDFKNGGEAVVYNSLATYSAMVPASADGANWAEYDFEDGQGTTGNTYVQRLTSQTYVPLESQYSGLSGFASTYRIVSNAKKKVSPYGIRGAVQQEVQLASIPVFQFAIFYRDLLEFTWAAPLNVRGRVHSNGDIYTGSSAPLTLWEPVTSTGINQKKAWFGFTLSQMTGAITYQSKKDTNVTALTLPIGTNNTSAAVHAVIEAPLAGEAIASPMGQQRMYNKAQMLVLVSNAGVTVGVKNAYESTSNNIPAAETSYFINTTKTMTDQRESKLIKFTELDIAKFKTWAATNTTVAAKLGSGAVPNVVFVQDTRSVSSSEMTAVRLVNGQSLPGTGLTMATPDPLYVAGHYNCPSAAHLGTTNTTATAPASLMSDALTLLSGAWNDSLSGGAFTSRDATDTTVNAAILTGMVRSGGADGTSPMSGGVVNLPRLLEDWGNGVRHLTLNGSMVNLFDSTKATKPFLFPGYYYYAPTRDFNFDKNLLDVTKQPPGTPGVRVLIRGKWVNPPPGTVNYAGN